MESTRDTLVFYSYSHKDSKLREQLETHLALLKRQEIITDWCDREISAGQDLNSEISEKLEAAKVILLLVSANFIASDYCYGKEMQRALERHRLNEATVIPIIIKPVDWQQAPFAGLKMLPNDAKAVTTWRNRDEAWKEVAKEIRLAVAEMIQGTTEHNSVTTDKNDYKNYG